MDLVRNSAAGLDYFADDHKPTVFEFQETTR